MYRQRQLVTALHNATCRIYDAALVALLTRQPFADHVEPLNRFIALAGHEAAGRGRLVCRTAQERALPNGHVAMLWQAFPAWLRGQL